MSSAGTLVSPDSDRRVTGLIVLVVLAAIYFALRSVVEIWDYNDFEVYWWTGKLAWARQADLYEFTSPVKHRYYPYPPAGTLLLIPLAWMSFKVAGLLWTLVKMVGLGWLLAGSLESKRVIAPRLVRVSLFLVTALCILEPITADIGNGQINLLVAATALLGATGLMSERPSRIFLGALFLAMAISMKATPALLLLLPLLQRRWGAALAGGLVTLGLFLIGPMLWFGTAGTARLFKDFSGATTWLVAGATDRDRQITLNEVILFTVSQLREERPLVYDPDERQLFTVTDGERTPTRVPLPVSTPVLRGMWFAQVLIVLPLALYLRKRVHRGAVPWRWDLAFLTVLLVLLSPMARNAHMVVLAIPFGYLASRCWLLWQGGPDLPGRRSVLALCLVSAALFLCGEHPAFPHLDALPMPYHPAIFVALLCMMGSLCLVARGLSEARD